MDGIDICIDNYTPTSNQGANGTEIISEAWTCLGDTCNFRSLMNFDLSFIPTSAVVTYATLSLYAHPNQINGHPSLGPTYGLNNTSFIKLALSPWSESNVTWNTQPLTTAVDQAILPQSTNNYQDYIGIDITDITQYMVSNPLTNYGFMIQLQTEAFYNCMIFCSSDFSDNTKHPELYVCYTNNVSVGNFNEPLNYLSVSPNPTKENLFIAFSINKKSEVTLSISNLNGNKLFSNVKENLQIGQHRITLTDEIKRLNNGVYILSLNVDDRTTNRRFVLIR